MSSLTLHVAIDPADNDGAEVAAFYAYPSGASVSTFRTGPIRLGEAADATVYRDPATVRITWPADMPQPPAWFTTAAEALLLEAVQS